MPLDRRALRDVCKQQRVACESKNAHSCVASLEATTIAGASLELQGPFSTQDEIYAIVDVMYQGHCVFEIYQGAREIHQLQIADVVGPLTIVKSGVSGITIVSTPRGTMFLPGVFRDWKDLSTRVDRELGGTYRFILTQDGWVHDDVVGFPVHAPEISEISGPLIFVKLGRKDPPSYDDRNGSLDGCWCGKGMCRCHAIHGWKGSWVSQTFDGGKAMQIERLKEIAPGWAKYRGEARGKGCSNVYGAERGRRERLRFGTDFGIEVVNDITGKDSDAGISVSDIVEGLQQVFVKALTGEFAKGVEKGAGKGDGKKGDGKNFFAGKSTRANLAAELKAFAESLGIDSNKLRSRSLGDDNTVVDVVAVAISDLCLIKLGAEFIEGFLEGLRSYGSPDGVCGHD